MIEIQALLKKIHLGKKDFFILLAIFLIGLFLRVYHLSDMVGFDFDQEYAAMFANTILTVYPIQMIGQGLSVQGLFMGPFYFYFLVPFFAFTNMHPIGGYVGSILMGLGGAVISYFLLRRVFGKPTATIGTLLFSILFLFIQYSWAMAPTYSSIFIVFITWFCVYEFWHGEMTYLPLLAFIFGLYTSFHPVLFPFYFLFIVAFLIKRKIPSLKILLISFVFFVLPLTPLLMFEYFRHFLEVKTLLSMGGGAGVTPKNFDTLIEYAMILFRFPVKLLSLPLQGIGATLFSGLFYLTFLVMSVKKIGFWKDRFHIFFFISTLVVFLAYNFILPTHVPDYYFLGVESVIFIYFTATLALLAHTKGKFLLPIVVGILICSNMWSLIHLWRSPRNSSLSAKDYILLAIKDRQNDRSGFAITYNIDPGQDYGLGYLTRLYGIDPRGEPDVTYEIVLPISRTKEPLDILAPSGGMGVVIHNRK